MSTKNKETHTMESKKVVIHLKNINKTFKLKDASTDSIRDRIFSIFSDSKLRSLKALQNVNLDIYKGEFFGIIGHNGSGKSTLLKIIMGAFPPDEGGEVEVNGKIIRLALGMGFDPNLTARENIYINGSVLGLTFREIGEAFHQIIEFAELENFVDTQVKFYSTGMRSRLAFGVAIHAKADIFLMDEFFGGVGDISFRKKSEEIFQKSVVEGRTIIHVSHQLQTIKRHCNRVLLLHQGQVVTIDTPEVVIPLYRQLMEKKKQKQKKV